MSVEDDLKELFVYMNGHCDRLSMDIRNAKKRGEKDKEEFYLGAQSATEVFLRLTKDILERNQIEHLTDKET